MRTHANNPISWEAGEDRLRAYETSRSYTVSSGPALGTQDPISRNNSNKTRDNDGNDLLRASPAIM